MVVADADFELLLAYDVLFWPVCVVFPKHAAHVVNAAPRWRR